MPIPSDAKNFVVGGDYRTGNTQYFKGTIWSIALFSDVRSSEQIKSDAVFVSESADSLMYAKIYEEEICNPYTGEILHVESDWIIDREATSKISGYSLMQARYCGLWS